MTLLAEMHVDIVRDEDGAVRVHVRSRRKSGSGEFTISPQDYNRVSRELTLLQHHNVAALRTKKPTGKLQLEVDKPCDTE